MVPSVYAGKSNYPNSGLLQFCNAQQLAVTVEYDDKNALYGWLAAIQPDIVFVIGYSHKINIAKTGKIPYGIYNVHFGSLPQFRGPAPLFWALKMGSPKIGLAIHILSDRFDEGPVVWQTEITNEPYFVYTYVQQLLANLTVNGVYAILNELLQGKMPEAVSQDITQATYYPAPVLKDVSVNWQTMSANDIFNLIKACNAWSIGAVTHFNQMDVRILDAVIGDALPAGNTAPGTVISTDGAINVYCADGYLLQVYFIFINGVYLPARHVSAFGITAGSVFQ